jgi:hypothetical protein
MDDLFPESNLSQRSGWRSIQFREWDFDAVILSRLRRSGV